MRLKKALCGALLAWNTCWFLCSPHNGYERLVVSLRGSSLPSFVLVSLLSDVMQVYLVYIGKYFWHIHIRLNYSIAWSGMAKSIWALAFLKSFGLTDFGRCRTLLSLRSSGVTSTRIITYSSSTSFSTPPLPHTSLVSPSIRATAFVIK